MPDIPFHLPSCRGLPPRNPRWADAALDVASVRLPLFTIEYGRARGHVMFLRRSTQRYDSKILKGIWTTREGALHDPEQLLVIEKEDDFTDAAP